MAVIKIAFWNVGGMSDSSNKMTVFNAWRAANAPDILFIEEVGKNATVRNLVGAGQLSLTAEMADKNGGISTKNMAVIYPNNLDLSSTEKAMTNQRAVANARVASGGIAATPQRRNILYLVGKIEGKIYHIYGMHANASSSGGNTAFDCMEQSLERNGEASIAGGDFNSVKSGDSSQVRKILPIGYDGEKLRFTQWAKVGKRAQFNGPGLTNAGNFAAYTTYLESVHLPHDYLRQAASHHEVKPHNVIDYILSNNITDAANLTALPNCSSVDEWFTILTEFDHCPVMYKLTVAARV